MSRAKFAGVCILAFVVLVAGTVFCITRRFGNQYDAQIAAIRAKGYPVTPAEFDAEPVADKDNAALVYEQVFQSPDSVYRDALDGIMEKISQSPVGGSPEQWAEALDCVAKCRQTVTLLEQAVAKPRCRFPRDWSLAGTGAMAKYPQLRRLAQFCGYRARVCAHHGDMNESVRSLDLAYGIWHSLDEEPGLIGYLVQSAIAMIASGAMHTVVTEVTLTEEQAKRLYDVLADIDVDESFRQAMIGELVLTICHARETAAECRRLQGPYDYSLEGIGERTKYTLYGYLAIWGDTALQLETLDESTEAVSLSYKEMKDRGLLDKQADVPFYALMSEMGIPTDWKAHGSRFRLACRLNADRVILALAAYKDRYGRYPDSLGQLRSSLGWVIPKDPHGGGDFGYRHKDKGYILYSTGPDAEDDGGVQNSAVRWDGDETGDWVWETKK